MVVVLPEPFTPTTRMTNGVHGADRERMRHRRQGPSHLGGENLLHLLGTRVAALAHHGRHPRRDVDAEIRANERLLDLLDSLGRQRAAHDQIGMVAPIAVDVRLGRR